MPRPGYNRLERAAVDRLDVLENEDELPHGICAARTCNRSSGLYYAQPSAFGGTRFICTRCRSLYRDHDRVLARIRSL